jgi:osmotically-inducible protein OsmY
MDDSERSYGYSRDIYHGRRGAPGGYGRAAQEFEESYEYGPEAGGMGDDLDELAPEELAMRIEGGWGVSEAQGTEDSSGRGGSYDYGRSGQYSQVDSFTWDLSADLNDNAGPHAGRGPEGYRRSDERIHDDICHRLTIHGEVDASGIEVKVEGCEVTLTGTVPDRRTKRTAEDVAEAVPGVKDVHNQLRIA